MERRTLRRSIQALPPAAWFLFAGTFIAKFGSFVLVFLALYLTREGYTPAVGGLLAERSFFLLFLGDALTSAAFGLVALFALPESERSGPQVERGGWLRAALADRGFLRFLLASAIGGLVIVQAFSTLPLQVSARHSSAVYGLLISLNGLLIVLFELPVASVTQHLRPRPVMAVGLLLFGLGFGSVGIADTVSLLALAVVVWTLGEIIFMPVAGAYVADVAPSHLRGRYQGAWGATFGIALVAGPALGTAVYSVSPATLWLSCLVLGAAAALLALGGPPRTARNLLAPLDANDGQERDGIE